MIHRLSKNFQFFQLFQIVWSFIWFETVERKDHIWKCFAFDKTRILPTVSLKKHREYFWRSRMICWLSNNLGAGREKVEASDLQFFQLWDLFSKYFSSEILIERYTRKWKFLHLTKGKSQGVKCLSSQGQQNSFFFAILIHDLQISSLYKVVKQYRWAD